MGRHDSVSTVVKLLTKAQEDQETVAVYADASDTNKYEVGFVEAVGHHHLVLQALTPKGEADGRHLIRLEDIHRIDAGTAYVSRLKLLHQYGDAVFNDSLEPAEDLPDMAGMLETARAKGSVVSLLDHEGYGPSGFVKEVAEDFVELQRLNNKGMPDGIAIVRLDAIDRLTINTREEQVLGFLYRYHYGLKRLLDS